MKPTEIKTKFVDLRAKGWSFDKIASELKVAKKTLLNWNQELKKEIEELKAIELKSLREQYYINQYQSIKTIGETLERINQEINQMDFSQIPPEKLLELKLKYMRELKKERGDSKSDDLPIFIDFRPAEMKPKGNQE